MSVYSLADQDHFEKGCLGKERFSSASAADAAIKMYRKAKLLDMHRGPVHIYQCPFAEPGDEHWHFGH